MKHKYVRTELGFIVWPMTDDVWHSHIGKQFSRSGNIISAGFADIAGGACYCYGESESLRIMSAKEDSALLAKQLGVTAE